MIHGVARPPAFLLSIPASQNFRPLEIVGPGNGSTITAYWRTQCFLYELHKNLFWISSSLTKLHSAQRKNLWEKNGIRNIANRTLKKMVTNREMHVLAMSRTCQQPGTAQTSRTFRKLTDRYLLYLTYWVRFKELCSLTLLSNRQQGQRCCSTKTRQFLFTISPVQLTFCFLVIRPFTRYEVLRCKILPDYILILFSRSAIIWRL